MVESNGKRDIAVICTTVTKQKMIIEQKDWTNEEGEKKKSCSKE